MLSIAATPAGCYPRYTGLIMTRSSRCQPTVTAGRTRQPNPPAINRLRRSLLAWYASHQRRLPWRCPPTATPNPYHVLVSEMMLQQTQVATVTGYFHRFVHQFPTIEALAAAPEQRVLRHWQGLGYYRRARYLHAAAGKIVRDYQGRVPDTISQLLTLPGVGRYTAGAVASIAFGRRAAILDGNVARVLSRWYAIKQPIDRPEVRDTLWRLALALVPAKHPGPFNEAMMDLGATVCLPRGPQCGQCPMARACQAKRLGLVEQIPMKAPRRPPQKVTHHVLAIRRDGRYLFQQRPDQGLWSAMWQMPTVEDLPQRSARGEHLRDWAIANLRLNTLLPCRCGGFAHQTTHRTIGFVVWTTRVESGRLPRAAGQWRRLDRLDDLPLANPQRRIVAMLA